MSFEVVFSCGYESEAEDVRDGDDELRVTLDTRHGQNGYRVSRYVYHQHLFSEGVWNWDESYQFYPSLDEVAEAYKSKNYQAGVRAF